MTNYYKYPTVVKSDIKNWINENLDVGEYGLLLSNSDESFTDDVRDELFNSDSVTGNESGSYTFNQFKAEENLVGNWDLLKDARNELCPGYDILSKGPE